MSDTSLVDSMMGSNIKHFMSEDINPEIVAELRKIRRMFCAVLVLFIIAALPGFYAGFSRGFSQATPSWDRVTTAMKKQDFTTTLSMAQALVARQPDYYYGQGYLGAIYLALGDFTNSESHYL